MGNLYREDILAEAGITEPPATWDDYATAAKAVKDAIAAGGPLVVPAWSSETASSARAVAISLRRAVRRSARRRELAKTIVERCCSIRSTTCSSRWCPA